MADIGLFAGRQRYTSVAARCPLCSCVTYIYLCILETLFQVVVDSVLRDRGQERHVRDTSLFLLERVLPVGLCDTTMD